MRPTPDQELSIRRAIAADRLDGPEDAIKEALALWEERERRRVDVLGALDEAEAFLARGYGRVVTPESMSALADEVRQHGRTRLSAERHARS